MVATKTVNSIVIFLAIIALITRFWALNFPSQVIFDEVHFGKFVTAYCCTHERIFDIHPPHVKLLIAGTGWLLGYHGGLSFDHIGQDFGDTPVTALRVAPALAGVLIPLLFFFLARQLKASVLAATLLAIAVVFDNALIVQSRVISLDTVLLVGTFGSLLAFLKSLSTQGWKQVGWDVVAGALAGLAVGAKFTGLSALLLLAFAILWQIWQERSHKNLGTWLMRVLLMAASAFIVYGAGWVIHYSVLTQPGPGDAWQTVTGNIWQDTIDMQKKMLSANYNLTATHPYSSSWWQWPWMRRPVFYWQGVGNSAIYFLGNPAVWWGGSLLFLVCLGLTVNRMGDKPLRQLLSKEQALVLVGFVIAFAPFVRIPRALFLYHFLTPLLFALIFSVLVIDQLADLKKHSFKTVPLWYWWVLAIIILLFLLFSPLTYGFTISDTWWHSLFWLPTWR